jgi:hypothetical protein
MSLTLSISDHWSDGKRIHVTGTLTASGNYPAGGDVIPFGNPLIKSNSAPVWAEAQGLGGYNYAVSPLGTVLPSNPTQIPKLRVFVDSTGAELTAGAYPAGLIAAPAQFYAIFPKFI